ncbi:MAG: hypothetical protein BWZ00_01245 [Bacteroidetes bacterium ADurb.BinA174]|nr:MAG: hypothetical protein BWZ00_01245 [Bacteroidetes bacterium ADurb.BinA174]
MKKIFIAFFIFISTLAFSQKIDDVFKTMPNNIVPGLSDGNRTMLLVDTGKTIIPYPLGEIEKLAYSPDFLKIKTSEIGTTQIKLLPLINDTQIICVVKTVCGNACDSHIKFYSTDWKELDANLLLPDISAESFLDSSKKDTDNYKFAVSLPDIYPISAEFENGSNTLKLKLDLTKYLSNEQLAEIKPFIKSETITLTWNNTSFR